MICSTTPHQQEDRLTSRILLCQENRVRSVGRSVGKDFPSYYKMDTFQWVVCPTMGFKSEEDEFYLLQFFPDVSGPLIWFRFVLFSNKNQNLILFNSISFILFRPSMDVRMCCSVMSNWWGMICALTKHPPQVPHMLLHRTTLQICGIWQFWGRFICCCFLKFFGEKRKESAILELFIDTMNMFIYAIIYVITVKSMILLGKESVLDIRELQANTNTTTNKYSN